LSKKKKEGRREKEREGEAVAVVAVEAVQLEVMACICRLVRSPYWESASQGTGPLGRDAEGELKHGARRLD
jgi:hypothetical protein